MHLAGIRPLPFSERGFEIQTQKFPAPLCSASFYTSPPTASPTKCAAINPPPLMGTKGQPLIIHSGCQTMLAGRYAGWGGYLLNNSGFRIRFPRRRKKGAARRFRCLWRSYLRAGALCHFLADLGRHSSGITGGTEGGGGLVFLRYLQAPPPPRRESESNS